jgi:hypothetical protein
MTAAAMRSTTVRGLLGPATPSRPRAAPMIIVQRRPRWMATITIAQ